MSKVTSITEHPKKKKREMKFSEGVSVKTHRVKNRRIYWHEFLDKLRKPKRTPETFQQYMGMSLGRQSQIKDIGYYVFGHFRGNQRKAQNLQTREAIALDIDYGDSTTVFDLQLTYHEYTYVIHSTHKHVADKPRLRIVFPLARAVDDVEHEALGRALADLYDIEAYDPTTFQFGRVMHYPSCSTDGEYVYSEHSGEWVDPDKILNQNYANWQDYEEWPRSSKAKKDLHRSMTKAGDPRKKKNWVGTFCRAHSPESAIDTYLSDVYEHRNVKNRYHYLKGSGADGLVLYGEEEFGDNVFTYSQHATDPTHETLCNAFDLVRIHRHGYLDEKIKSGTHITRKPSYRAMLKEAKADPLAKAERATEIVESLDDFEDLDDPLGVSDLLGDTKIARADNDVSDLLDGATELPYSDDWIPRRLELSDRDEEGYLNSLNNVVEVLKHDKYWADVIRYNDFSQEIVIFKHAPHHKIPPHKRKSGDTFLDGDAVELKYRLEIKYRIIAGTNMIFDAVELTAKRNRFHPVKDYLHGLPPWDGVKRVDSMLYDYLGVAKNSYTVSASRKFLCGAINRVMNPGTKWDYCLVLEGPQGQKKSSWIKALAQGFFIDSLGGDFGSKAAIENMRDKWIIELAEMDGVTTKKDSRIIKGFLSRDTDRMRPAYGRVARDFERQCIFIGTTNNDNYLVDETGNRRFWPILCGSKDIPLKEFRKNIDQLWAEALVYWRAGEPLFFNAADEALAKQAQDERLIESIYVGVIEEWLDKPVDSEEFEDLDTPDQDYYRNKTCIVDVWRNMLHRDGMPPRAEKEEIRRAFAQIKGWTKGIDRFGNSMGQQRSIRRDNPLDKDYKFP